MSNWPQHFRLFFTFKKLELLLIKDTLFFSPYKGGERETLSLYILWYRSLSETRLMRTGFSTTTLMHKREDPTCWLGWYEYRMNIIMRPISKGYKGLQQTKFTKLFFPPGGNETETCEGRNNFHNIYSVMHQKIL